MDFWKEVAVDFVGNVLAGFLLLGGYVLVQWFLVATDITISYVWRFDGTMQTPFNLRPSFDIRNRSRSKTYYLANIGYLKDKRPAAPFDNKSVWGKELKPGTITFVEAVPLKCEGPLSGVEGLEVHVYLQNGRQFWLRGSGPGALKMTRVQRAAFWLRRKLEASRPNGVASSMQSCRALLASSSRTARSVLNSLSMSLADAPSTFIARISIADLIAKRRFSNRRSRQNPKYFSP